MNLFGSESKYHSEEKKKFKEVWVKAYHKEKNKNPKVPAKVSVLLDVKPWNCGTNHNAIIKSVKSIKIDGFLWGANRLAPISYGITKPQIVCTVKYNKVFMKELQEKI